MPAKVKIVSRFHAAIEADWAAFSSARDHAIEDGREAMERRVERTNSTRGYHLPTGVIGKEPTGHQSGRIFTPAEDAVTLTGRRLSWWVFFEYGTSRGIPATGDMRAAHRKMRATFVRDLSEKIPTFIRQRASVRPY